ncbi:MAG TPA: hypothetical protein VJ743_06065 [Albitalea sp.]|nr:hypothetical protein [Albitalea sp.]
MPIKRLTKADLPQSLGAFKPVGHVLMALRDEAQVRQAQQALLEAGFDADDLIPFSCEEHGGRMDQMLDHASEFAGFGYEIVLMRRYKKLCEEGCRWLLIYAPQDEEAQRVAEIAKRLGSPMAVKYHRLVEEDLI